MKTIKAIQIFLPLVGIFTALFLYGACFVVDAGEVGLLAPTWTQSYSPGLHFKWPWQRVVTVDVRPQVGNLDTVGTIGAQALSLKWALTWRVTSPALYLRQLETTSLTETQYATALTAALQSVKTPTTASLSSTQLQETEQAVLQKLQGNPLFQQNGVTISALKVVGVTIPQQEQSAVFEKMQASLNTLAQGVVADGQVQAQQIRTAAETQFLATQQNALKAASQVMATGNQKAMELLAPVYQEYPALFTAYSHIQAQQLMQAHS